MVMDLYSSDLLWSLFVTSLSSYRRDTVLRPFPSKYAKENGEKDFDLLKRIADLCPSLHDVNQRPDDVNVDVLNLLRLILNPKTYSLQHINDLNFSDIHKLTIDSCAVVQMTNPDHIFEVRYSNAQEEKFEKLRGNRRLLYAYHGSKIENFYSILNCGLRNNLNKVGFFGEGIYLSSDLSVCLTYSPSGQGWSQSIFGDSLCCVAVCEMIDDPDVKCTLKMCESQRVENCDIDGRDGAEGPCNSILRPTSSSVDCQTTSLHQRSLNKSLRKRSKIAGSEGGEIPEKYFVVRNDDLVRVKYLLLYCPNAKHTKNSSNNSGYTNSIIRRHRFLLVMLFYVIILLGVGLYRSNKFSSVFG